MTSAENIEQLLKLPYRFAYRSLSWWYVVPAIATLSLTLLSLMVQLRTTPPSIGYEGAFFMYIGRALLQGKVMYLEIWDVKPPAIYETMAIFALFANSPADQYIITYSFGVALITAIAALLAISAYELTDSKYGALLAGLTPILYVPFFRIITTGLRSKYFVCFFGLLSILAYLHERPKIASLTAALASAYWQLGIVFPIGITVSYYVRLRRGTTDRTTFLSVIGVIGAVAAIVTLPILMQGAHMSMILQVVVTSFVISEPLHPLARITRFGDTANFTAILAVIGMYGATMAQRRTERGEWWIPLTVLWFGIAVLFVDFDGAPDLIPFIAFSGLGVAFVYAKFEQTDTAIAHQAKVLLVLIIGAIFVLSVPLEGLETIKQAKKIEPLFWSGEIKNKCHIRLTADEKQWIQRMPTSKDTTRCWNPSPAELFDIFL